MTSSDVGSINSRRSGLARYSSEQLMKKAVTAFWSCRSDCTHRRERRQQDGEGETEDFPDLTSRNRRTPWKKMSAATPSIPAQNRVPTRTTSIHRTASEMPIESMNVETKTFRVTRDAPAMRPNHSGCV